MAIPVTKKSMMNLWNYCFICKNNFPTMRSLSAHMRAHPGRICRVLHPRVPVTPLVLVFNEVGTCFYMYKCSSCSGLLPTLKALAAHAASHTRKKLIELSRPTTTSIEREREAPVNEGRGLDIDLNKLPFDLNEHPPEFK